MNEPSVIETALTRLESVLAPIITYIGNNPIMLTMFAGGLFVVGAKVFKRIKNSVK